MTVAESQSKPYQPAESDADSAVRHVRRETLLFLVPSAVLLALGVWLTVLVRGDDLLPGELATTKWLAGLDNQVLLWVSEFLDFISEDATAPVLFVILLPIVWLAFGRAALLLFAVSGSLTGLTRIIELADRSRPTPDFRFEDVFKHSGIYPSGHVVYGVMVFGMIAYLAFKLMQPGLLRTSVVGLMLVIVVLMGPSRVIELDHWPADVVGSFLLAVPFLLVLIWIDRHPVSQPGGWIYGLAMYAKSVEDRIVQRLFSGRH